MAAQVVACFLVRFDVHVGYELVWQDSVDKYFADGVEFKALPSGLHSVPSDTVVFTHDCNGKKCYGLAVFHQNNALGSVDPNGGSGVDRSQVKMYSLGILIDPEESNTAWKLQATSKIWNYRSELTELVKSFVYDVDDKSALENVKSFFKKNKLGNSVTKIDAASPNAFSNSSDHMIDSLINLYSRMGPLIYKLWRLCLLRKRILIVSNDDTVGDLCKFVYCMSVISSIPVELKPKLYHSGARVDEVSKPAFNFGISDPPHFSNWIATTKDEIILQKTGMWDYVVDLNELGITGSDGTKYWATPTDLERFKLVYPKLVDSHAEAPDFSRICENSWEFIWSSLKWWASAGEVSQQFDLEFEFDDVTGVMTIVILMGYFQKMTTRIFSVLIGAINDDEMVTLDAQDLIEMGLDGYNESDWQWVEQLVETWWGFKVKRVGILSDLCCWG